MSIRDELLEIQRDNDDNILHPREVVEWARRNTNSALHSAIEWDDQRAADAYRLVQVRRLIEVHVVSGGGDQRVISLSSDRTAGGGYRSEADVIARPDLRAVMLRDALEELERVQAKYERVKGLSEVWEATDAARAKAGVRRRRARAEERATA